MSEELAGLFGQARSITENVEKVFGKLTAEQLNWKPSENDWSIAQCFEHLVVTNDLYFENIQKVADGTHRNNLFSKIPFVPRIISFGMKKVLSPDWSGKMKTFKMFEPTFSNVSEDILRKFAENQNRFISLMEATKDLNQRKIKIAEPMGSAVNLRLIDVFEILIVHEQRHFNQAKRVLEIDEFPK